MSTRIANTARSAREKMIERLKTAHLLPKPKVREDSNQERSANAAEARQRYLARVAGRTFSNPPGRAAYREDGASDPLAWYRTLLTNSGYPKAMINEMLRH